MGLSIVNLSKAFAAPVLRSISLDIQCGEIRGLVGENGAGKSTLLNILAGNLDADGGEIILDDRPYRPSSVRQALDAGVALATQELSTIETLTAAENLSLSKFPSRLGLIDKAQQDKEARSLLSTVGLTQLSPATPAAELSLAEQQLLEIARASWHGTHLLMLDEPTAALSREQADLIHELIKAKAAQGVVVIYVSHRLEDLKSVCQTISVLRDGEMILTRACGDLTIPDMIEAMAGRFARREKRARPSLLPTPMLRISDITTKALPHPISLEINAGEIVGLAGLAGAGRTELIKAIMGIDARTSGTCERVTDGGAVTLSTPADAVAAGIGYVPEDRKMSGIFAGHGVAFNMSLPALRAHRWIPGSWVYRRASEVRNLLNIRSAGLDQPIDQLSGGNQQKVILGRWLMEETPVLLLDEPGRGVDVAAKTDIFDEIARLAGAGAAVMIASSEMDELTMTCDRIVVMSGGRVAGEFNGPDWDEQAIMTAAFSAHVGGNAGSNDTRELGTGQ
ncbi:sugar ABC transporter ATP-binding protein [Sphingobium chlorophenolicum]|uniref:L-arabinose transporter ATP-binding protein n=1 Tax=Sphingobium chlorophenolicum TaxID=46429 RepID=A0A081RF04_SPHCR|nr:sugar ABC transporter ATP-binding protein [Sphingobium chlorophenolicum]KEQ53777.1 L-arabinose transporter ATP-binding protein [Sphingobium chlorophenolicum]